jgi:hypothetical protein
LLITPVVDAESLISQTVLQTKDGPQNLGELDVKVHELFEVDERIAF